jgi:hypothetical protein
MFLNSNFPNNALKNNDKYFLSFNISKKGIQHQKLVSFVSKNLCCFKTTSSDFVLFLLLPTLVPKNLKPTVFVAAKVSEVRQHQIHERDVAGGSRVANLKLKLNKKFSIFNVGQFMAILEYCGQLQTEK